jgi:SPP1 gp7 family putative phage head morphogenesis protein
MAKRPPVFRTFTEAVEWFITLGIVTREEADELTKAARAQAFWISNVAQMDVVQDVFNEIERSLRLGLSLRDFKRSVAPKLYAAWGKADAWRLETIYRVNVMRAYNAGRYQRLSTPRVKRLLPFRRWKSLLDLDTTSQCRGRHNKILPADDPWWDDNWPPIHYNCRSIVAPINRRRAERLGVATAQDKKDFTPAQDGWGASPAKAEFADYKPKPDGKDPRLFSTMTEKVEADAQLQSD